MSVDRKRNIFLEVVGHLVSMIVIVGSTIPMLRWYYSYSPLWGVDFYYTVTLLRQFAENWVLWPVSGWNYIWFGGWPTVSSYPVLHTFLMWPISLVFGFVASVKVWMLVTLVGYLLGMYACFWTISRSRSLGILLAIAGAYSVGVYGSLMWGGSLPSFATQMFFPWTVWAIVKFLKGGSWKWIFLASLLAGLSILGHPLIAISYIFPTSFVLFVTWFGEKSFFKRIRAGIMFGILALVIGLPILWNTAGEALKVLVVTGSHQKKVAASTLRVVSQLEEDIDRFHRKQPQRIVEDTNLTIYGLGAIGICLWAVSLVVKFKQKSWGGMVATVALGVWYVVYITIYAYGVSIYHGGWYRLFWATPLWLGLIVSALWGGAHEAFTKKLGKRANIIVSVAFAVLAIGPGVAMLVVNRPGLEEKIILRSTESSAFPDVMNLVKNGLDFKNLKKRLVPTWMPADSTDYRMYASDQTVNIWWNSMYKMPLARGYYDPPVSQNHKGYFFWVDASLSWDGKDQVDQLVGSFGYPPQVAKNNTLYLIDWYSIKYFEGNRVGLGNYTALPKWLETEGFFNKNEEVVFTGKDVYHNSGKQILRYWEVKDDIVTPVGRGVSVPVLGVVGSDVGYENVVRALADANFNSTKIVSIKLGRKLDALSINQLKAVDALFVYDYDYFDRNKAWLNVENALSLGRNVYIDTGIETKESAVSGLPAVFPMDTTVRQGLGNEWVWADINNQLFAGVDTLGFAAPVFDGQPWSFSYPANGVRSGVSVMAKNNDKIVLTIQNVKKGKVVWSGMNLPYHVSRYHALAEVKLWENLMAELVGVATENKVSTSYKFINSQKRVISTSGAKGILVKEQLFPGWWAIEGVKKYDIYAAGPSWPGFMYIPLPDTNKHTVSLVYVGSLQNWILISLSLGLMLFVVDSLVFDNGMGRRVYRKVDHLVGGWLRKDDE